MKQLFDKTYFHATKEVTKGRTHRTLVAVFPPRRLTEQERVERGTAALEAEGYKDIKYGSTISNELIFG